MECPDKRKFDLKVATSRDALTTSIRVLIAPRTVRLVWAVGATGEADVKICCSPAS